MPYDTSFTSAVLAERDREKDRQTNRRRDYNMAMTSLAIAGSVKAVKAAWLVDLRYEKD